MQPSVKAYRSNTRVYAAAASTIAPATGPPLIQLLLTQHIITMTWAQCLKRVFGIDIETCPACGGTVRIVACIEDQDVIEKILKHVDEKLPGSVLVGLPPSRASPQIGLFD